MLCQQESFPHGVEIRASPLKLYPRANAVMLPLRPVAADLDCQLEHGLSQSKCLVTPVRGFLGWINQGAKTHSKSGSYLLRAADVGEGSLLSSSVSLVSLAN